MTQASPHENASHSPRKAAPDGAGKSPLLFIFLTVFIDLLGFGIVIPLLPVYSKMYGASDLQLGILFATFSAMQFLFAPMWGRLSDKIGRKPILVGGLFGTALAYVMFANASSLTMLFVARGLAGFFGANISTAQAYVADVTTPDNRAKGMGMIGAAFGLGFTIGPLIGGELTKNLGEHAPGWFAAGLSATAALFGWLVLREPTKKSMGSRVFNFDQVRAALREARIGTLLVLNFLFITSFAAFESFFVFFGMAKFPEKFGLSHSLETMSHSEAIQAAPYAGRYLFGIGIVSALIQGVLIRRMVKRFGETTLATAGPLLLAIGFLMVAFAPSWPFVIAGCLIMPLGFGINNPALTSLISRASPEAEQGAYLGLSQSVSSLARMTGPLVAALMFKGVGPSGPFYLGAALLVVGVFIANSYRARYAATFPRTADSAVVGKG